MISCQVEEVECRILIYEAVFVNRRIYVMNSIILAFCGCVSEWQGGGMRDRVMGEKNGW